MNIKWLGCLPFFFLQTVSANVETNPSHYNWKGFYVGATGGGAFAHFDTQTSTRPARLLDTIQSASVNRSGQQNIYSNGFISGVEGGYNWQYNKWLLGLESDLQTLSLNGTTNTGAITYPNRGDRQYVITSYANANWLLTLRPRLGYLANNWLFFLTAGPGITVLQSDFLFTNNDEALESKRVSQVTPAYEIGAGIETGITNSVSVKAEYRFLNVNNVSAHGMADHHVRNQAFSNNVSFKTNIVQLGVNYHFNDNSPYLIPALFDQDQWQTEVGTLFFASSGSIGAPDPLLNTNGTALFSRLTYSGLTAYAGETFGRVNHLNGIFVKGNLGAGSITGGRLNDEDFPAIAGGAYSNTFSTARGNLSYADIDLGYSFIKTASATTGIFVGYNYYSQHVNVYGCRQEAGSSICVPSTLLSNFMGISEEERFDSLRIGFGSQFEITPQMSLATEAAYLPFVNFSGVDNHNARQLIIPERSAYGDGAMLESILNYQFADSWNVGIGARYWMWNMHEGTVTFEFLGDPSESSTQVSRFYTNRYGVFLQLNYNGKPVNHFNVSTDDVSWHGIFVGGYLGGGWGNSHWADPFGASIAPVGRINQPYFGDDIYAAGPLGGVAVNLNWQTGQLIYGLGGTFSGMDVRGDNTLFSGLGGINGQEINNYLVTLIARLGTAYDRSLFYINGGRAMLDTTYSLTGNTDILNLGAESQTVDVWGWTAGAGIEYALNNRWTTNVEYDYVNIPGKVISYSRIDLVNQERITASQNMNVFKVGLNYRFDPVV